MPKTKIEANALVRAILHGLLYQYGYVSNYTISTMNREQLL